MSAGSEHWELDDRSWGDGFPYDWLIWSNNSNVSHYNRTMSFLWNSFEHLFGTGRTQEQQGEYSISLCKIYHHLVSWSVSMLLTHFFINRFNCLNLAAIFCSVGIVSVCRQITRLWSDCRACSYCHVCNCWFIICSDIFVFVDVEDIHIFEYATEFGFLRMSPKTRQKFNITTTLVLLGKYFVAQSVVCLLMTLCRTKIWLDFLCGICEAVTKWICKKNKCQTSHAK